MKSATTVFQVERFKRLLRAHWAEQRRSYALFWLIVASLHALLMLILLAANHGKGGQTEVQAIVFWCGLIASGAVLSGLHFSALRKPGAALILLTRPATALEKWLLAVLFVLIVWPLAYAISATVIGSMPFCVELDNLKGLRCTSRKADESTPAPDAAMPWHPRAPCSGARVA